MALSGRRAEEERNIYESTWVKCIQYLAIEMGARVRVFHTGRRTSMGVRVADALSNGNMNEVR